jgi:hypothetical protein
MRSGITVQAMRPGPKGGPPAFCPVDICDLSDDEFVKWWLTIEQEKDKFFVANTLRRLTHNLSDFGDEQIP